MDIREDIADLMAGCVGCGQCRDVCPSLPYAGSDPMAVMNGEDGNVLSCMGCGRCSSTCGFTDPHRVMMYMKHRESGASVPDSFLRSGFVMPVADHPSRGELSPEWRGDDVLLMAGCTVECRLPFLKHAGAKALEAIGIACGDLPGSSCCMFPVPLRGLTEGERDSYKQRMGRSAGGKGIVTLCPGCSHELSESGVRAENIVHTLSRNTYRISGLNRLSLKVAIQPGCRDDVTVEDIKSIVLATGASYSGNSTGCCGKTIKGISEVLMKERQREMEGADAVVVACPSCFSRYDSATDGVPVLHVSELVALAYGDRSTLKYHMIPPDF